MKNIFTKHNYIIAAFCIVSIFAFGINAQTVAVNSTTKSKTTDTKNEISDANIAAIVSVAGSLDIAYGKIAMSKSNNKQVREFAERMVNDHSAIQDAAVKLLNKLGVTPAENETSRGLAANGEKIKQKLNSLSGAEFDKFYIDNEVAYHALVVNATENVLIANAKNAELKSTLESVLPLFERHLEHAKMIQASFSEDDSMSVNKVTDANIRAIVTVAGGLDISYGTIAMSKSKNKKVREFAERMIKDHTAVQNAVNELSAKLNLVPKENETSRGLAANGVEVKAKLNSLEGKEFDKYYIDNEVAYHALVVNATANLLIPNATNPELKAALEQALPLFERHLEHAKMVQESFNKGKSKSKQKHGH